MAQTGPPPGYVEVNERLVEWREKYPDGSLQSDIVPSPFEGFICVKARAFRTPDDQRPGEGLAWEPVPGKTNFTRDSELMNAETSAWGRALIAVGAADAKRGIASANEVRSRQGAEQSPSKPAKPPTPPDERQQRWDAAMARLTDDQVAALHEQMKVDDFAQLKPEFRDGWLQYAEKMAREAVPF